LREHRESGPDGAYPIGEGPKLNVALVKKWVRVGAIENTLFERLVVFICPIGLRVFDCLIVIDI